MIVNANPKMKLNRLVKSGKLFCIRRGLYNSEQHTASYLLAECVCSPSYLSFDFALSFYGIIPERVFTCTSATFRRGKRKLYESSFGTFCYRDVPSTVFPYEIKILNEEGYYLKIASPEKALCDKVYSVKPVRNLKGIQKLLLDDMRIELDDLMRLNTNIICELAPLYHSQNLSFLVKFIRRNL